MPRRPILVIIALSLTLSFTLPACESDSGGVSGGGGSSSRCTEGDLRQCQCPDGSTSNKLCGSDRRWGECPCSGGQTADVVGQPDITGDSVTPDTVGPCAPACDGKACGPDGCGGACGACQAGWGCVSGACVEGACDPDCVGKVCGPDGCGGACGACPAGTSCDDFGACVQGPCTPDCVEKQCGPDGCGGSCGACPPDTSCNDAGWCQAGPCQPQCAGKQCGPDGCDGSCGACPDGTSCDAYGQCAGCQPDCYGKSCGGDGCGGSCGSCYGDESCVEGQCMAGLSCQGFYGDCVPACPTDSSGAPDQPCLQSCFDQMTTTGQAEYNALGNCLQSAGCYNMPSDEEFYDCLGVNCMYEYYGCFHGDWDCAQISSCLSDCSPSDQDCIYGCTGEGTQEAQVLFWQALDECLIDACCPETVDDCNSEDGQVCIEDALEADCELTTIMCSGG